MPIGGQLNIKTFKKLSASVAVQGGFCIWKTNSNSSGTEADLFMFRD